MRAVLAQGVGLVAGGPSVEPPPPTRRLGQVCLACWALAASAVAGVQWASRWVQVASGSAGTGTVWQCHWQTASGCVARWHRLPVPCEWARSGRWLTHVKPSLVVALLCYWQWQWHNVLGGAAVAPPGGEMGEAAASLAPIMPVCQCQWHCRCCWPARPHKATRQR